MHRFRTWLASSPSGAMAAVPLLAAAIIVVVGGWQLERTRTEVLAHAADEIRILSHALAQHAARTIDAVDLTLEDVSEQASRPDVDAGELGLFIHRRAARLEQLRNLAVVRADGSWVVDALANAASISSADRAYFTQHRDHADRALQIGDPITSRTTGKPSIPLSRRIDNQDGSFGGVVIATLAPEYLAEFYKQVKSGERGTVAVWSPDGRLLLRYPAIADLTPQTAAATTAFVSPLFKAMAGMSRSVSPLDGVERLFAFEHLDGLPLVVSASVSVDDALAGWRHTVLTQGAVIGASALLLVLLALGLDAHRRRIASLLAISQAIDRRCRMLADNTGDMITHMALDGTRLYVSPAARELLGYEPDALVGSNPQHAVHPDDAAQLAGVLEALAAGRMEHAINVNRLRHRDGRWIWVEASLRLLRDAAGRPASIAAAVRDVMDRQHAAEALRDSEARYRALAETTSDVITQLDLRLRRHYVSPSCRDLLGYLPDEMLGVHPSTQIHPDDLGATKALAKRLLAGKIVGDRAATTHRMRHKDGHWVWVEAAFKLVRNSETGTASSLICSLRDVTERQRAARHLERAKAAAEAATRAKTDFVANMSHELRTPLTGILGVLDLLRRDPLLSREQGRLVGLAGDAGTSLMAIVNDVLDFSKIEAGQLTLETVPFGLDALVASCCGLAAEALKTKPVELRTELATVGHRRFLGDPVRLRQVLLNLLLNAAKFTERGHITVAVGYQADPGLLRVDVTDTGIGIPADAADTLFERFSQADTSMTRRFGGTGLGLAICKRLVVLMAGRIGAEPRREGGSNFYFEVPLRAIDHDSRQDAGADPAQNPSVRTRLLLAEDNALNAEVITAMLAARGYRVTVVGTGAAAVDVTKAEAFDLVLMDLQMPVMDGLAATAAIRARERALGSGRLPIVGLTANAMAEDAARCAAGGMDAHVAKPIAWPALFGTIEETLGRAAERAHVA